MARQRDGWERGTLQVLRRHRRMIQHPRYGVPGMLIMPVFVVVEGVGPFIELPGYGLTMSWRVRGATRYLNGALDRGTMTQKGFDKV